MKCKVSVIVPVYNAAKYLEEMIASLSAQTLKEIEFIFVDDCSSDNSLNILYEFEKKDPDRMIVIKSDENQGPGGARNIGLQYASGEYIGFVDSDDYIKPEMYECLYEKAIENDYDLVECGYFSERKNKDMMLWDKSMEGEVSLENRVRMFISCGFICTKLFKRSIITNSQIEFIHRMRFEDIDFLNRLYCRIEKVGIVNKYLYYYRDNQESFTNKSTEIRYFDVNNTFSKKYLDHMKKEKIYNILRPVIEYVVMGIWYDMFRTYVTKSSEIDVKFLQIIDKEIKQHISDYSENIFFVEQAKKDIIKEAFLVNSHDPRKVINILEEIVK
ncbi:glycosyltransferase family 2 protein [Clostridium beijerinckii]|uniref:Glycosyltransferase involved in cell wall biosynthesis n=1 Tax=Clostridium beijerinckii TaxID=1520 RepID=A0A1S8R7G9_CLOBE|nr:glycosyltransferase family 2 protein [Clostridium beijerinckii]NRT79390.1 glycosyltransferase involved in cell wall biosynthesis [Clostridium beijerinckii]NSB12964.1 glycosyltransferase involved in cell wall biosynthesis [Clostridium beijerinckii]OOM28263.1 putative glycosyltransferase EpsJ [Clostridium beijerinckii]OOM49124.1 putative glycosyltransferase EpsJ [Clostridium beijerinckii]